MKKIAAVLVLACFAKGNHAPTAKIVKAIEPVGYNENTLKVQVAQVAGSF